MDMEELVMNALKILKSRPDLIDQTREDAAKGNSTIGGVLWLQYKDKDKVPREVAEAAVRAAVAILDSHQHQEGRPR